MATSVVYLMSLWKGLSQDGQTITIRRFNGRFNIPSFVNPQWIEVHRDEIGTGAVVDVETTGLDRKNDRVIEIAIRTFNFHRPSGQLVSIGQSYSGLQDPGFSLSAEITEITGLMDSDVKGQNIDWALVMFLFDQSEFVIAHNAGFDRPFIEKELGEKVTKVWACSFKQIDWVKKGYGVQKLELLSAYHGFFTDAHRAMNDVDALLNLLGFTDAQSDHGYLSELYVNAHRSQVKVIASGAPFEAKDFLRIQGYRWDSEGRAWNRAVYQDLLATEVEWLEREIYRGKFLGKLVEIPLMDQFQAE